jgi:hypothetical protein
MVEYGMIYYHCLHKTSRRKREMDVLTKTKQGNAVRLTVERDAYSVYQVYATLIPSDETAEKQILCDGWGTMKAEDGLIEGIQAQGQMIEVPRKDWNEIVAIRQDLRNKENLADIRLVKVYSHGDQLTVDAYTLSAGVDRDTWRRIEPYMEFVDSADNDVLYAGDRFVGWVLKKGSEEEVERILEVRPENSIRARTVV